MRDIEPTPNPNSNYRPPIGKKKTPDYSGALDIACRWLERSGECTHFPGYVCDKDFTTEGVCAKCIRQFFLKKARTGDTGIYPEHNPPVVFRYARKGKAVPSYRTWLNSDGDPVKTVRVGWECPFCGDTGIKKFCPSCGAVIEPGYRKVEEDTDE